MCDGDDQCGDWGWCACDDRSCDTRVCKAFVGEGERCGGFVPADLAVSCGPNLRCVADPRVADIPGTCATQATVAEILAQPADFDGRFVFIDAQVGHGYALCTQMACSPEAPCCNTCGAEQQLFDADMTPGQVQGLTLEGAEGEHYGCSGDSCGYGDNCALDEVDTWVLGTVRDGQFGPKVEAKNIWAAPY